MAFSQLARDLCNSKQAAHLSVGIKHAMSCDISQIFILDICCKMSVCSIVRIERTYQQWPIFACIPCRYDTGYGSTIHPA